LTYFFSFLGLWQLVFCRFEIFKLKAELALIREKGYATNFEEWREGVHGLGAAIFDRNGVAVAAVGLSAPASRLDADRAQQLGLLVKQTAEKITRALGARMG
jgi:IclR family acetate operon transcriptional repressor